MHGFIDRFPRCRAALRSLVLGALVCASTLSAAVARDGGDGHGRRGGGGFHAAQMEGRAARQAERIQQRAARGAQQREVPAQRMPQREQPAPVAPPVFQQPEVPAPGRPGRLTPDERRALRQQINEAGRDVYRPVRP